MENNESLISEDSQGIKKSTWIWLFTYLCLFGILVLSFAVYKFNHKIEFHLAAKNLNLFIGTLNTFILITSGLTSFLALYSIKKGKNRQSVFLQVITLFLGLLFIINRIYEWVEKADSGLLPGSTEFANKAAGEAIFFTLYFLITGLHTLVVIFTIGIFVYLLKHTASGKINFKNYTQFENREIHWQFIVAVWVVLFPIFYLIS